MSKALSTVISYVFAFNIWRGCDQMTEVEFIAKIAPFAVADMRTSKVSASLTISQAALESGWGDSGLTVNANTFTVC